MVSNNAGVGNSIQGTGVFNVRIAVHGTIVSGGNGIFLSGTSLNNEIFIGQTGAIFSDSFTGVFLVENNNSVVNLGQIATARSYGILLDGNDSSVFNSGTIIASSRDSALSRAINLDVTN